MARRTPEKPYKGILTVPTPPHNPAINDTDALLERFIIPKFDALFDHYDIPRDRYDRWYQLAMHLALTHVPGFAPSGKQGRKGGGQETVFRDLQLLIDLGYAEMTGTSVKNTVRLLTRGKHARGYYRGQSAGSLRNRYYRLQDPESAEGKRVRRAVHVLYKGEFLQKWFGQNWYQYRTAIETALSRTGRISGK